jgi:DNA-binding MarR family transcriptional regulator
MVPAAAGRPAPGTTEATRAVRALIRLSRALERRGGEISLAHYRVLMAVAQGDERASRVAERLALGKPAVSASVEALCARGLLTRSGYAGDQRSIALALTPAGQGLLEEAEAAMSAELEVLAARTGRRAEVLEALSLLGTALEERAAERRRPSCDAPG